MRPQRPQVISIWRAIILARQPAQAQMEKPSSLCAGPHPEQLASSGQEQDQAPSLLTFLGNESILKSAKPPGDRHHRLCSPAEGRSYCSQLTEQTSMVLSPKSTFRDCNCIELRRNPQRLRFSFIVCAG